MTSSRLDEELETLGQELDAKRDAIQVGTIVQIRYSPYEAIRSGQVFQISDIKHSDFDGAASLFYVQATDTDEDSLSRGESIPFAFYIHEIDLINNNKEEN